MITARANLKSSSAWCPSVVLFALVVAFSLRMRATPETEQPKYLSPGEMAISADGTRLYIVCERSNQLLIVDTRAGNVIKRIDVGAVPRGLALSPKGDRVYVTNSWDDTVSVIDARTFEIEQTLKTGAEPIGISIAHDEQTLFVANRLSDDVSVIDLPTGHERKRLLAGRGASYLALSPDGSHLYCTHVYPRILGNRTQPQSEITVIDTARQIVIDRLPLQNVAGVFHVVLSPDGRFGVAAQLRPKNLIPMAHVEHGWVFGNSLS